jgi:hypothetical protein
MRIIISRSTPGCRGCGTQGIGKGVGGVPTYPALFPIVLNPVNYSERFFPNSTAPGGATLTINSSHSPHCKPKSRCTVNRRGHNCKP